MIAAVRENARMSVRDDFLTSAETAVALLAEPAVADQWTEPSALRDYSTGGLATHLASQLFQLERLAPSSRTPISITQYFGDAAWVGEDADHEVNIDIRQRNELLADEGPAALLTRAVAALEEAHTRIGAAPVDRVVQMSLTGWSLSLDDFLITRMLELIVHTDDLAVSVGLPTPAFPEPAVATVVNVLGTLAIRRHGPVPVLRALSRAERAPETISAL